MKQVIFMYAVQLILCKFHIIDKQRKFDMLLLNALSIC
jgi:hypothetical protein